MSEAHEDRIELTIDGRAVRVAPGTTIWDAARRAGIEIPVLCHDPRLAPVGVCRMCVVDVGERVLAAACVRECEEGMEVRSVPGAPGYRGSFDRKGSHPDRHLSPDPRGKRSYSSPG